MGLNEIAIVNAGSSHGMKGSNREFQDFCNRAGAAIDAGAAGVVSYCRSFGYPPSDSELPQGSGYSGAGVTLNRGDDSPGTDSGRQATSCETTTVSTLG